MKRPYTGNKDGVAAGEHPQLTALIKELVKAYSPALWSNGSFGVRNMKGKESLSVHATGRAVDISFRIKYTVQFKANFPSFYNLFV